MIQEADIGVGISGVEGMQVYILHSLFRFKSLENCEHKAVYLFSAGSDGK